MTKQFDNKPLSGLEARLRDGTITRREFIGRATALGVTAALATTIATSAVAATPKKGGHMRLAMGHGSTTDTMDPATVGTGLEWVAMFGLCNTLTELAADGKLVPSLAESWESSPDAKVWRFKIRKGVEFHNGRTLTAKDIVGNFRYHTSEESTSVVKPILSSINEIKIDGGDTVVFSLDAGNADFPFNMNQANLMHHAGDGRRQAELGRACRIRRLSGHGIRARCADPLRTPSKLLESGSRARRHRRAAFHPRFIGA